MLDPQILYVSDFGFLAPFFNQLGEWIGPAYSGLDIETEGVLSPHDGETATVQIELDGAVYVVHIDYPHTLATVGSSSLFRRYLEDPRVTKAIHNATFELKFFIYAYGDDLNVASVHDTMAGEYILAEGSGFQGDEIKFNNSGLALGAVVERRYGVEMDKDKELRVSFRRRGLTSTITPPLPRGKYVEVCEHPGCDHEPDLQLGSGDKNKWLCYDCSLNELYNRYKSRKSITLAKPYTLTQGDLSQRQLNYAAFDAIYAAKIAQDQLMEMTMQAVTLGSNNLGLLVLDSQVAEVVARMELEGMPINETDCLLLDAELQFRVEELAKDIQEALWSPDDTEPVNPNSDEQMVPKLQALGYKITSFKASDLKHYITDPLMSKILEYKKLNKVQGTYTGPFLKKIHAVTRRIHTSFNQFVTATGRLSSSNPNLQNLPSKGELAALVRGLVQAPEGFTFVICDYSNIEMRLIAEMYHDDNLIRLFNEDMDAHAMTGSRMLGISYEEMVARVKSGDKEAKNVRARAKCPNFGLGYGAGRPRLQAMAWEQYDMVWSDEETDRAYCAFHDSYPGVGAYHRRVGQEIKNGTGPYRVQTQDGRVRRMPRSWFDPKENRTKSCYSAALNHPIQGTSADMMKRAMVALMKPLRTFGAKIILQIHDELVVLVPIQHAEVVKDLVQVTMEAVGQRYLTKLPIKADPEISSFWKK